MTSICKLNLTSFLRLTRASNRIPYAAFTRNYSEAVHDHFSNPRNVGSLDKNDPKVGTAYVGKAACGDVIKLSVKVEDGTIQDAKFKTFGCGSAIASSSLMTEMIKGKTLDDALSVKNTQIAREFFSHNHLFDFATISLQNT
eukprot:Selendium_serpulae@DN5691_c0_g1_i5.p2